MDTLLENKISLKFSEINLKNVSTILTERYLKYPIHRFDVKATFHFLLLFQSVFSYIIENLNEIKSIGLL